MALLRGALIFLGIIVLLSLFTQGGALPWQLGGGALPWQSGGALPWPIGDGFKDIRNAGDSNFLYHLDFWNWGREGEKDSPETTTTTTTTTQPHPSHPQYSFAFCDNPECT